MRLKGEIMQEISNENQTNLRSQGLIKENEVAYVQGDLLVAVNVVSQDRRVVGQAASFINESVNKRILKG